MKKVLLVLVALVLVVSGVAMVSAYEAHLSNVKVHVENALTIPASHDFGTMFPEEWSCIVTYLKVSNSFCSQRRVNSVNFTVWVEEKEGYPWLGDALYLRLRGQGPTYLATEMTHVGYGTPPIDTGLKHTVGHSPWQPYEGINMWIGLDAPVFEGYYNPTTDVETKPSGLDKPTVTINVTDTERYFPEEGVTLGADIKIQVTAIW